MRSFAAVAAFAALASAIPHYGFGAGNGCLTKASANKIVDGFIQLTNGDDFDQNLAEELITKNVLDTSSSVASIINAGGVAPAPLGDVPLITNRTGFVQANSAQGSTPYEALNIYWSCDVITFRFLIDWQPQPVVGISILELVPAKNSFGFKIKQVFGELNSWSFLVHLGIYEPTDAPPAPPAHRLMKRSYGFEE